MVNMEIGVFRSFMTYIVLNYMLRICIFDNSDNLISLYRGGEAHSPYLRP